MILPEPERQHPVEALQRLRPLTQLEQRLAESRQRFLIVGIQRERTLEAGARPGILFQRKLRVGQAYVQLYRLRVQPKPLTQLTNSLLVETFVVEPMGAFRVIVGAQEGVRHMPGLHGKVSLQ